MPTVQEDIGCPGHCQINRYDTDAGDTVAEFLFDVGASVLYPADRLAFVEGAETWQIVLAVDMHRYHDITFRAIVEGWTMDRIAREVHERKY